VIDCELCGGPRSEPPRYLGDECGGQVPACVGCSEAWAQSPEADRACYHWAAPDQNKAAARHALVDFVNRYRAERKTR
jgi:hypothetical protein